MIVAFEEENPDIKVEYEALWSWFFSSCSGSSSRG